MVCADPGGALGRASAAPALTNRPLSVVEDVAALEIVIGPEK
jgi:hypothetical protein